MQFIFFGDQGRYNLQKESYLDNNFPAHLTAVIVYTDVTGKRLTKKNIPENTFH